MIRIRVLVDLESRLDMENVVLVLDRRIGEQVNIIQSAPKLLHHLAA
ncbi:hypothetical protein CAEBREN_14708 [Caenorhabditis brenneri]|uniref:Uncharacterized protein n=1 Tax=Caenorhabditis brenneri TaxID=135651 RepID=G0P3A2_CAEBE|nr:hypothetical protein CAEBREN_14708 [Caenorhabditis brenneri]